MTREDYEAHKEDYKDNNVSSSAFVLIQDVYIRILEEQLKAKNERIRELKEAIKPKTCEGCSNLFFDEIEKVYKCSNDVSDDVGYLHGEAVIRNIKDFYCAQYRSKE